MKNHHCRSVELEESAAVYWAVEMDHIMGCSRCYVSDIVTDKIRHILRIYRDQDGNS